MKKTLLLITMLLMTIVGQAQIITPEKGDKIRHDVSKGFNKFVDAIDQDWKPTGEHDEFSMFVIPRLGVNLSNLPGLNGKMKVGFVGGGAIEIFPWSNFAVDVELGFSCQGSADVYTTSPLDNGSTVTTGPYNYKLWYLNTAALARWYPMEEYPLSVYAGVNLGRLVYAHSRLKGGDDANIRSDLYQGDIAIPIGASYEFGQWQFDLRYNFAFRHIAHSHRAHQIMGAAHNSMLQLTVGYRIQVL